MFALSALIAGAFSWLVSLNVTAQDSPFVGRLFAAAETKYSVTSFQEGFEIHAEGANSASGLYHLQPRACFQNYPIISWSWRVDIMQKAADIRIKSREDFAASLHFVFGEPGMFSRPKVLAYAWTATDVPKGTVIKSPRVPENFRTLILRTDKAPLKTWREQRRNVVKDFEKAYGARPEGRLTALGVFTDNDQTREPVESRYRLCG